MLKDWAARDGFEARGIEAAPTHLGDRVELLLATAVESSRWRGGHAQSRLPKPHIAATAAA